MPMRVDQARQQRSAAAIDRAGDAGKPDQLGMLDDLPHLAVVRDDQRSKVLELAIGVDLDAVDVADQRVGKGGGGGEERGKREQGLTHGRSG